MGYLYTGEQILNNTLKINGHVPVDRRMVVESISDIFITAGHKNQCELYTNAFTGMVVSTFEGTGADRHAILLTLKDHTPYTVDDTTTSINADNYRDYWTEINESSITEEITAATFFQGGDDEKTRATLVKHGSLPAGTTIEQLEGMTLSELFKNILFEVITPTVSVPNASATASWRNYSTAYEVGSALPAVTNVTIGFTSKQYQNIASDGTVVKTFHLSKYNPETTTLEYIPSGQTSTTIMMGTATTENGVYTMFKASNYVLEGVQKVVATVKADPFENAVTSDGKTVVANAVSSTITKELIFTGCYRVFSNALHTYTSISEAWDASKVEEDAATTAWDENAKKSASLANGRTTMYFKWPSGTLANTKFKVYVPSGYVIESVLAADDFATDKFNINMNFTQQSGTTSIGTTTGHGTAGTYSTYVIEKSEGTTNVQIIIKK